ncbi:MAG TPA: YIP1 family protein [Anaeromyxobacteraceae bacterium]|nr:YIP1 family protein [Anaeromyxobacteraceae bacterium]
MLARCAHCQKTFETDRFGIQACPHCGQQVHLADPSAPPPVPAPPPAGGPAAGPPPPPPDPAGSAAPVARRRELGFLRAWLDTWKLAALSPAEFFRAVRISDTGSALLFGVTTLTVSSWFQTLYGALMGAATRGVVEQMLRQVPRGDQIGQAWVMRWVSGGSALAVVAQLFGAPFFALAVLLVSAALFHVVLLALRSAPRGFAATLTVVGYASAAHIIGAAPVPLLANLVGFVWYVAVVAIGLSAAQRIPSGKGWAAALLPFGLVCMCCCGAAGIPLFAALGRH